MLIVIMITWSYPSEPAKQQQPAGREITTFPGATLGVKAAYTRLVQVWGKLCHSATRGGAGKADGA